VPTSTTGDDTKFLRADGTWVVPTDTDTTYSTATATTEGLVKIEDNAAQTIAANTVTATASRTYGVQLNASDQAVVNVPWTDTDTGITDVVDDTSPQLGGNLDFQTHKATSFTSTGIDDNATSTAITIDASENVDFSEEIKLDTSKNMKFKADSSNSSSRYWKVRNDDSAYGDLGFKVSASNSDASYSSVLELMSDGRGLSQFTAKAWVNFADNGSINDSHNISSVSNTATGVYTVNFTNSMANTNYVTVSGGGSYNEHLIFAGRSVGSFPCYGRNSSMTSVDVNGLLAVFGD
jgi:hypothetical protein